MLKRSRRQNIDTKRRGTCGCIAKCNSAQNETRHRWLLLPGCTLYGVKNVARNFMDWLVSLSVLAVNGTFAKLMGFHLYTPHLVSSNIKNSSGYI